MLKQTALAALSFALAPCAIAGDLTIADIAPAESMVVFGVNDTAQAMAAFDRTGLKDVWNDPSIQDWFKEISAEFMEDVTDTLDEIGFEKNDIKTPTGAMGMAMWFTLADDPGADPVPSMVMFADYGNDSEAMHELVLRLIEKGEEEDAWTLTEDDYRGVTYFNMSGDNMPNGISNMTYAVHDGNLFMTTGSSLLEHCLDTAMGDDTRVVTESDTYNSAVAMVGEANLHAAILVKPMTAFLTAGMAAEMGDDAAMVTNMLDILGISDIEAISLGGELDTAKGVMEARYAVRVPEKTGLVKLFDQPAEGFNPPAFVGADVASFTSFKFDISGVPAILQEVMAQMPPDQSGMFQMFMGMAQPILMNLGPDIYHTQSFTRPFSGDSQRQLVVIETKDATVLSQAITSNGAMMGLAPRDFMGNQIWSAGQPGMMGDSAIGLGFGHIFIGTTTDVENAMRLASNPGDNSLANHGAFRRAAASTGQGIGFSYSNIRESLEYADWSLANMERLIEQQMNEAFAGIPEGEMDEQFKQQLINEQLEMIPAWMRNAPEVGDLLLDVIGDTVTEVRSTPEGFVGSAVTLRPSDD